MKLKNPKIIRIEEPIYPKQVAYFGPVSPWIMPGRYEVVKEFDKDRYIIRLSLNTVTIVKKSLTKDAA